MLNDSVAEMVPLCGVSEPPITYFTGASCNNLKEKKKSFLNKEKSLSTGKAALSRGTGKGAGASTWPGDSGGKGQAGEFGEESGARDNTQESSGLSDFPAA